MESEAWLFENVLLRPQPANEIPIISHPQPRTVRHRKTAISAHIFQLI
jgi:hypothetical protein